MNLEKWKHFVLRLRDKLSEMDEEEEKRKLLSQISENVRRRLLDDPWWLAREKQLKALRSDSDTVLILCGRGWGKNFTGAHWIIQKAREGHEHLAIIGETASDVRDYMVEGGPSSIMKVCPEDFQPNYYPSKRRIVFPNGARITTYSGEKPDQLRGLSGSHIWADEFAKYRYIAEAKEQIDYTLREGDQQQLFITTTPRPHPVIKDLVEKSKHSSHVDLITGSSFENKANLGDRFLRKLEENKDTRLGQQEVYAKILENHGDLWGYDDITHVSINDVPEIQHVVIGLDPTVSTSDGDEAGIVIVGLGVDGRAYVLADLSGQYNPSQWAAVTIAAYRGNLSLISRFLEDGADTPRLKQIMKMDLSHVPPANEIYAERNQGGNLVQQQLSSIQSNIAYDSTHTQRSKFSRAEPVHTLYQTDKVKHVGHFSELEDQMTDFTAGLKDSPDRVDALVYGISKILLQDSDNSLQRRSDNFSRILALN
jgi:phage terminase large subunit-like protein